MTSLSPHYCCSWMVAVKLDTLGLICDYFSLTASTTSSPEDKCVWDTAKRRFVQSQRRCAGFPRQFRPSKDFPATANVTGKQVFRQPWGFVFADSLHCVAAEFHFLLIWECGVHIQWRVSLETRRPWSLRLKSNNGFWPQRWLAWWFQYIYSVSTMLDSDIKLKESPEFTQFSHNFIPINYFCKYVEAS